MRRIIVSPHRPAATRPSQRERAPQALDAALTPAEIHAQRRCAALTTVQSHARGTRVERV
jgi:hypothetical protein